MTLVAYPRNTPPLAAMAARTRKAMDVILHIGAHRCATTSFQNYLRKNTERLSRDGIGFWGPRRTRNGMFSGLLPGPGAATGRDRQNRAAGRIQLNLSRSETAGVQRLIVSDENMMGSVRGNLRLAELYCGVGERMARYAAAFGDRVTDVVLNVRALDSYWSSALSYGVVRGRPLPTEAALIRLAANPRSWRDVIADVACAVPGVRLHVLPFETFGGRPDAQLRTITGQPAPVEHAREWLNAAPRLPELRAWLGARGADALAQGEDRWHPFSLAQSAALRELYADDLVWLTAGADGLARLVSDPDKKRAGLNPPPTEKTRGRRYDDDQRRLAGTG